MCNALDLVAVVLVTLDSPKTESASVSGGQLSCCLRSFVLFNVFSDKRGGKIEGLLPAGVGVLVVMMVVMTYLIDAPVRAADVSWCLQCSWDYCCFQHNECSQGATKEAFHYLSLCKTMRSSENTRCAFAIFANIITFNSNGWNCTMMREKLCLPDCTMLKSRASCRHKYFLFAVEWLLQNIPLWLEVNLHLLNQLSLRWRNWVAGIYKKCLV